MREEDSIRQIVVDLLNIFIGVGIFGIIVYVLLKLLEQ